MKAVIQQNYQGIAGIKIEDLPRPTVSQIGKLVKVSYVPVLPWDIRSEEGTLGNLSPQNLPTIIGYGFSGVVEETGSLRSRHEIGKRVIGVSPQGSYAEYVHASIPFYTFELPESVSLKAGATIIGGADAALMMLKQTKVKKDDKVLVVGASGGVGTYLIQLLRLKGIKAAIFSSKRSYEFSKQIFPANEVYSDTETMKDEQFDIIFDTTGNEFVLSKIEHTLKSQGLLFPAGSPNYSAKRKDISVMFKNSPLTPLEYQKLIRLLADGSLTAYIDSVFDYQDVKKAQTYFTQNPKRGRVLVKF